MLRRTVCHVAAHTPAEGKDPASCMSIVNTVAYLLGNCASG
jgi:hypothetical protein